MRCTDSRSEDEYSVCHCSHISPRPILIRLLKLYYNHQHKLQKKEIQSLVELQLARPFLVFRLRDKYCHVPNQAATTSNAPIAPPIEICYAIIFVPKEGRDL